LCDFQAAGKTRLTIATVNNGDMVVMQGLSNKFEQANPDIQLRWVILEENVLRQRTNTDVASPGGQFDVLTIGSYETPILARRDWLKPLDLPASYDVNDLIKPIREGLSNNQRQTLCCAVLWRKFHPLLPKRLV
jgi:sorbitol/mannitol transport system substrate-binding protein